MLSEGEKVEDDIEILGSGTKISLSYPKLKFLTFLHFHFPFSAPLINPPTYTYTLSVPSAVGCTTVTLYFLFLRPVCGAQISSRNPSNSNVHFDDAVCIRYCHCIGLEYFAKDEGDISHIRPPSTSTFDPPAP